MGIQTALAKTSGKYNTYIGGINVAIADLTGQYNTYLGSYTNQYGTAVQVILL